MINNTDLKISPKYKSIIKSIYTEEDGYRIFLEDGYVFEDMSETCEVKNKKDANEKLSNCVYEKCKECLARCTTRCVKRCAHYLYRI